MTNEEAIQVLANFYVSTKDPKANHLCEAVYIAIQALKAEPVKHGRWVKTGQSFIYPEKFRNYTCSECGSEIEKIPYNFCPWCGVDMREVEE